MGRVSRGPFEADSSRARLLALAVGTGALVGALALNPWEGSGGVTVPERPEPVEVELVVEATEEPLPALAVPELEVRTAPEPGSARQEGTVPPRPRLRLAGLVAGPAPTEEPLPALVVPELEPVGAPRPCAPWRAGPRLVLAAAASDGPSESLRLGGRTRGEESG